MCVIAGYIGQQQAAPIVLEMIRRQQGLAGAFYTGLVTIDQGQLYMKKAVGDVDALEEETSASSLPGSIAIAHGRPNSGGGRESAHPFVDANNQLAYIANGARGHFQGITDYSDVATRMYNQGHRFTSARESAVETAQTLTPDGKAVHASDVMAQLVSEAHGLYLGTGHPLLGAIKQTFENWPAEIVALCLHASDENHIAAARHNLPMLIGQDQQGGVYIASMAIGFPPEVTWHTTMPPQSAALLARDGNVLIQPLTGQRMRVAPLLSPLAVKESVIDLLRHGEPCKADTLMNATLPWWPEGMLNQKEVVVYQTLGSLMDQGAVCVQTRFTPGADGRDVPQSWFSWTYTSQKKYNTSAASKTATHVKKPVDLQVHDAIAGDLPAILSITRQTFGPMSFNRIREQFFGQQMGDEPWHHYMCDSVRKSFESPETQFMIGKVANQIVAFASYWFDPKQGMATIGYNAVSPEFQNRGIASRMLADVRCRFIDAGYENWQVTTLEHDHPARRVYEKLGFEAASQSVTYLRKPAQQVTLASNVTQKSQTTDGIQYDKSQARGPRLLVVLLGHVHPQVVGQFGDYEQLYTKIIHSANANAQCQMLHLLDQPETPLPDVKDFDGIIVGGGASNITDNGPWLEPVCQLVNQALKERRKLLGICLGHQILGHVAGAAVGPINAGWKFGRANVTLAADASTDPLLGDLPQRFEVNLTHRQGLLDCPTGIKAMGMADHDPQQVIRVGDRAWGVQYHPEFTQAYMRAVLETRRERIDQAAGDGAAAAAETTLGDTPFGSRVLERFVQLCSKKSSSDIEQSAAHEHASVV